MLWGGNKGTLEVRAEGGATHLRAVFPYGSETELAPGRLEVIAPRAFADRIENGSEIHLLAGHSYDKPLASRSAGTLHLTDTDEALEIRATLDDGTTWARDFLAAHGSGLIKGLSPGFRVAKGGETIERRGAGMLRTIGKADLFELSAVTRPAYPAAQIEARAWETSERSETSARAENAVSGLHRTLNRWRA